MGILDDAIRQHLELKRQHGVPEEELQRQEEEALGPARRDVAEHSEEAELAPGQTATAEVDEPAPASAEEETALFDMEEADAATAAEPEPAEPELAEPEMPEPETPEPEPAEPTPVEPPPVEPPPEPDAAHADSFASYAAEEAPVGEPGHEPDPNDALGDTEPHGFEAVVEDEDEEPLASDPEDPLASDPEDPLAQEAEDEDLDVLEDTPDFLQETPEHDRLWFEQKPPRDFDFD